MESKKDKQYLKFAENGERLELYSPTALPNASAFLWNKNMLIQTNCRGYAVAQFMQPEPAKYAYTPSLEGKTFMQPEQPYYAHHPGRFCYLKDEYNGNVFSAPHEPVRAKPEEFIYSVGKSDIKWIVKNYGITIEMTLRLTKNEPHELWIIKVTNNSNETRALSLYPYFPVGYMSWMNQSGEYNAELKAIICSSVTPYQKHEDYPTNKEFKDKTFLIGDTVPDSWEVNQEAFEGEGGLHNPSGIQQEELSRGDARYEIPACILQYRMKLLSNESKEFRFVFGPAKNINEISLIRNQYLDKVDAEKSTGFSAAINEYDAYIKEGQACINIQTPDSEFDNFVNHWLPRQIYYHGETNRLCTDPQTRNYLQDSMGLSYIKPEITKQAILKALSQQDINGAMPEGVKIHDKAELKYINQVPHTDHCVWLPICLKAYLDETNDYELLNKIVPFDNSEEETSVFEHINKAMYWLLKNQDDRGLNYINQGDWCDPMNMVGYKGKGVSGWLTQATAYAIKTWADICAINNNPKLANQFSELTNEITNSINKHLWDKNWYARGITDNNKLFGISTDKEGSIFLNPQAWALLSGAADKSKTEKLVNAVEELLESPYGVEMLGPPFTSMREDIGRVTQKFPGSAENGSVYNHATAFYIFGLLAVGKKDNAYRLLRKMIPGPESNDIIQRGQLPVFIPNYYRGAYSLYPRTAGRSSQLFNTGTVHWYYRCLIEGLFGLKGNKEGLQVEPQLPEIWNEVSIIRKFRGAEFKLEMKRISGISELEVFVNNQILDKPLIRNIEFGKKYEVRVNIPMK